MRNRLPKLTAGACALLASAPLASADVLYETPGPFGGPFGLWGMDVFVQQSAGTRFVPTADAGLDRVSLWFMNNSETLHAPVTVTLRTDGTNGEGVSIPGTEVIETWTFNCSATGWNPVQEHLDSVLHPQLVAGTRYWIVCESSAPVAEDPVWNFSSSGLSYNANTDQGGTQWFAGSGAALTARIEGTPGADCPADFDGQNGVGVPDIFAFLAAWFAQDPRADFDGQNGIGVPDIFAFLAAWFAGCP